LEICPESRFEDLVIDAEGLRDADENERGAGHAGHEDEATPRGTRGKSEGKKERTNERKAKKEGMEEERRENKKNKERIKERRFVGHWQGKKLSSALRGGGFKNHDD
jgi:hypothetical protein